MKTNSTRLRAIARVLPAPRSHWVGDGFHVKPVFADMAFSQAVSPFLMFDFAEPKTFPATEKKLGVGQHPHRGFETVTIAFKGEVEHGDSRGNRGVIGEGDVQWMTAASGIIHEEFHSRKFAQSGGVFSMAQIWVNLPKKDKMSTPRYQPILKKQIKNVSINDGDCTVRVIAGVCEGEKGPAKTFTELNMWDVSSKEDKTIDLRIPSSHNAILFVREGNVKIHHVVDDGEQEKVASLRQSQVALFPPLGEDVSDKEDASYSLTSIRLSAFEGDAKVLLLSGVPIDEPIAARGPFVMNTNAELDEAWRDFYSGKMGGRF